ncbi:MAG: PD40 domain-containing protein [Chitinophagaceae bacterium]|nr:PD40 domain-containing protein [Chitinophagaceae bacterium]
MPICKERKALPPNRYVTQVVHRKTFTIKFISTACCLLLISCLVNAQWYDPKNVHPKVSNLYAEGINNAQDGKYPDAIRRINEALLIDPKLVDGHLSLAGIYANLKNYNESVKQFETGFALDSIYSKDFLLPYSISLSGAGLFDKALAAVNKFLAISNLNDRSIKAGLFRKKCYEFAIEYARTHVAKNYVFAPVNLGDNINTKDLEYFPSLTVDGNKMIFTKRINGNEDFYETDHINGSWSKARSLEGNINSPGFNEGAQNISQDGNWLIFTGCNFPEGLGSCDLYISYLTKNGWSKPENLGPNVNSEFWESSPSLSPDKKDLYFSSNVPGGFGGKDIWVCHRNANGNWNEPLNLGAEINTPGDESCPFIHADNQTLYFNSNGHQCYSEKPDLFVSRKMASGKWSAAENLGYPINTIDDEGSMVVASDGKTAYYASDRSDTKGGLDIYTFELREDVRPLRTLWVKGKVYDKKTKIGLPSSVELTNVATRQATSKLQTDEVGNYLVTLPVGNDYAFNVNRKGYLFYSQNFDLRNNAPDSTYQIDIPLQSIEVNAGIVLKNVFFNTKETVLKPESVTELDNVVRLLNENPNLKIQIGGHTDNVGKPADNLRLSVGRAVSVVNYLLTKGVKNERLTFKGYGETKPLATNNNEEGRALNRRTELSVVSN